MAGSAASNADPPVIAVPGRYQEQSAARSRSRRPSRISYRRLQRNSVFTGGMARLVYACHTSICAARTDNAVSSAVKTKPAANLKIIKHKHHRFHNAAENSKHQEN